MHKEGDVVKILICLIILLSRTWYRAEPDVRGVATLAPLTPEPLIEQTGSARVQSRTSAWYGAVQVCGGFLKTPKMLCRNCGDAGKIRQQTTGAWCRWLEAGSRWEVYCSTDAGGVRQAGSNTGGRIRYREEAEAGS